MIKPLKSVEFGSVDYLRHIMVTQERLREKAVNEYNIDTTGNGIFDSDGTKIGIYRICGPMIVFHWFEVSRNEQFIDEFAERYYKFKRPALRLTWGPTGMVGIFFHILPKFHRNHKEILGKALQEFDTELWNIVYKSEERLLKLELITPDHTSVEWEQIRHQINQINSMAMDIINC